MIVGDTYDDPFEGPVHGFSLDKNSFTQFDFPEATFTIPYTVNNLGMHGGSFTGIDPLSGENVRSGYVTIYGYSYQVYAEVFGLNDKGQIVGSYFDPDLGRTVGYVRSNTTKIKGSLLLLADYPDREEKLCDEKRD